jgi:hypothetical protein
MILIVKKCVAYPEEKILFKIGLLLGSKLIKTKIIIKKYEKYFKKGYPTKFADSNINHNNMAEKSMISTLKLETSLNNEGEEV